MADTKRYLDMLGLETLVDEIKAADAAGLQSAKDYADGLATNYDAAGSAAGVKTELQATIDGLANVYDAKGSAEAVDGKLTAEVNRATGKENELAGAIAGVKETADKAAEDILAINNAENGILAQAKADATTKANAVQANVDALSGKVGEIPEGYEATTVTGYIKEVADDIIANGYDDTEVRGLISDNAEAIDEIEKDYLKAADKSELQGKIDAEAGTRKDADDALAARIKTVEDDYLKAADKTELTEAIATAKEEAIATVLGEGVDADFDTLKEVAEWILSDTTGAAAMQTDVATLKGEMDAVEGRMDTAEGDIEALEGEVAKKVDQTAYNEKVAALEGADSGLDTRLQAIEAKFTGDGEGSVADQIADAADAAKEAAIAAAAADATSKANTAEANAKSHADGLNTAMNARVEAVEAEKHSHANKLLLDTYTQTEANLADAVAKKHNHENKSVLDGISAEKVAAWDASEQNAKDFATGLNNTLTATVNGIDGRLTTVEGAVATKAEDADLDALAETVAANTAAIQANTTAIGKFVRISENEISGLFV